MRDMTQAQFRDALKRHGMTPGGFMGHVDVGIPGHKLYVCGLNAGSNRRAQLAYLLTEKERNMEECECGHMHIDHYIPIRDENKKTIGYRCQKCECRPANMMLNQNHQGTVLHA